MLCRYPVPAALSKMQRRKLLHAPHTIKHTAFGSEKMQRFLRTCFARTSCLLDLLDSTRLSFSSCQRCSLEWLDIPAVSRVQVLESLPLASHFGNVWRVKDLQGLQGCSKQKHCLAPDDATGGATVAWFVLTRSISIVLVL